MRHFVLKGLSAWCLAAYPAVCWRAPAMSLCVQVCNDVQIMTYETQCQMVTNTKTKCDIIMQQRCDKVGAQHKLGVAVACLDCLVGVGRASELPDTAVDQSGPQYRSQHKPVLSRHTLAACFTNVCAGVQAQLPKDHHHHNSDHHRPQHWQGHAHGVIWQGSLSVAVVAARMAQQQYAHNGPAAAGCRSRQQLSGFLWRLLAPSAPTMGW